MTHKIQDMIPRRRKYTAASTYSGGTRRNAQKAARLLSSVCRVCLGTGVRMYQMSEHGLSAMYARVVGVWIKTEDKLPRQLCWECVGRLSSANRFIDKALKTQLLLMEKISEKRLITISDIESINRARFKLESTLVTKFNTVNEYDFLFTEETVEPINCNKMQASKSAISDCIEDIELNEVKQIFLKEEFPIEIDLTKTEQEVVDVKEEPHNVNDNEEKQMFLKEEFPIEIDLTKTEQEVVGVKEEPHNANDNEEKQMFIKEELSIEIDLTKTEQEVVDVKEEPHNRSANGCKGAGINGKTGYSYTENINRNDEQVISIKDESTTDEEPSGDEIAIEMSQKERQVVDKSSEVCEVIKQSKNGNNKGPLWNQRSKLVPDCKKKFVPLEDTGWNIDNKEHTSKQDTANADQSAKQVTKKIKNEIPIKNRIIFEDDMDMVTEFSSNCEDADKPPLFGINAQGTSHDVRTNTRMARNINKLSLSGSEHPQDLFICDICDKSFDHKPILMLHIKKHPKMYYCTGCSYKTFHFEHLKQHVHVEHTKEVSNCPHCRYETHEKSNLVTHINTKHIKSTFFNCPHCTFKAYPRSALVKHVKLIHT